MEPVEPAVEPAAIQKGIYTRCVCLCVSPSHQSINQCVARVIICPASTHTALVSSPSLAVLHLSTYLPVCVKTFAGENKEKRGNSQLDD